jgi:iron(III) transport system substrate-binding protein
MIVMRRFWIFPRSFLFVVVTALAAGCYRPRQPEVVVYASLDREFSEPLLDEFTKATGIRVLPKYDEESTKTVGLTNVLIQESGRPRCDVFWNNEGLNTIRLDRQGLLAAYQPPNHGDYPKMYQAADGTWHGFAARARIVIVNTKLVPESERPTSIYDLAKEKWKGKTGIARPIAGTTATHVACLFAVLGDEKAKEFLQSLKTNDIQILGGNKQVAQAVAAGQIAFGLTDTDDAVVEIDRAASVEIVYPDRGAGELGTLFVPNTLARLKNCPHPKAAERLIDYLLSPAVEEKLARGASAQIPLNEKAPAVARVETPRTVKPMPVDFAAAADKWDAAMKYIEQQFLAE